MLTDTIVAVSTALQEQAISIIRLSGSEAFDIANKMFNKDLKVKTSLKMKEDHTYYGQKKVIPVAEVKITF